MTQNDVNSLMRMDKITRFDFFEKLKLELCLLKGLLRIFKRNLYRSVKISFYRKLYRFYVM